MAKVTLTVTVSYRKSGKKACPILTDVVVRIDGKKGLAFKTLGGRYTAEQAKREFLKIYNKFEPLPGNTAQTVETYAKLAA